MELSKQIKQMVEEALDIEDIGAKIKERKYVVARCVYAKLARKHTYETYKNIGEVIDRNHTTVIHLEKSFDIQMRYEKEAFRAYKQLDSALRDLKIHEKQTKLNKAISKLPFEKYPEAISRIEELGELPTHGRADARPLIIN